MIFLRGGVRAKTKAERVRAIAKRAVRWALGWVTVDRVVLCNCPAERSEEIAKTLIEEGLAGCVNVLAEVKSVYEWKGKIETETESTLLIKTTGERVAEVTARVLELHPYELPEVIVLPVIDGEGHEPYLRWLRASVTR